MKGREVILLSIILILLFNAKPIQSHAEHAEPEVEKSSLWYKMFLLHDWIHPIFFLLMIYSCYYFRIFSSIRISKEPKKCLGDCTGCYKPEGKLKQYHRYFFWITLVLTFVHLGEIMPSLNNFNSFLGIDFWVLISETTYLGFAFLYLGTCYHFRYFIERIANKNIVGYKFYNALAKLNRYHDIFFWLVITSVIIRFILVVINTNSIIKAIPGTF